MIDLGEMTSIFTQGGKPRIPLQVRLDGEAIIGDATCVEALLRKHEFALHTAREEAIPLAYHRTFQWIFE
jgi:hypothetical protein